MGEKDIQNATSKYFKDGLSREQESDRKAGRTEASQRVQNFRRAPVYRTPCQQASAKVSQG